MSEREIQAESEPRREDESRRQAAAVSRREEPLALWLRALLFLSGWALVLVGIAGLVLPGIQGILTLLAGAAVLSLASELAYKVLRFSLQWFPRVWGRVARWRRRIRRRLTKLGGG